MEDDGFKICPFCKENIQATAVKCGFCGEWLEQPPSPIPSQPAAQDAVKTSPPAIEKTEKATFRSPLTSWAEGINSIPIPKTSKTAHSLIFYGLIVFGGSVGGFISLGLMEEKTNHYNGPIAIASLIALGTALTGIGMMIRGGWFFLASTNICKMLFAFKAKYNASSSRIRFASGFILFSLAVTMHITAIKMFEGSIYIQLLLMIAAIILACLGIAMMWKAIKTIFS